MLNKRPMGLDALLGNQFGHLPKFHVYFLFNPWFEIELIFTLGAAVSEIRADFQNCHIWAWNLATGTKFQKLHIYHCLSTRRGRNWAYFRCTGSGFRDTCRFSKLPYLGMKLKIAIFGHETWPLAKIPQVAHIHSFYPSGEGDWAYFLATGSGFRDMTRFSKLPYLGMKLGHLSKFQKLQIYSLPPPGGRKLGLFLVYGQRFLRYRQIFKIAIFGHETWPLAKVPETPHIIPKLPPSPKLHSVLLYG